MLADGVNELVSRRQRSAALGPVRRVNEANKENVFLFARLQLDIAEDAVQMVNLVLQLDAESLVLQLFALVRPELRESGLRVVLTEHNDGSDVVVPNESPEVADGVLEGVLGEDELVAVVVALQEGGVDVVGAVNRRLRDERDARVLNRKNAALNIDDARIRVFCRGRCR